MQKITPFLWFDANAEEAANYYLSIFKDSHMIRMSRYPEGSPGPAGSVMTVEFSLAGQQFVALNGGPQFSFTPAISFVVNCETQEEIDFYWHELSREGEEIQCGWLQDKFGISWQIVPTVLGDLLTDPDKAKAQRVMTAMLAMKKIEIAPLLKAAEGNP